ncbi:MAG: phosphatidate cytidylyltransferase [Candidatus Bruticola sp.]
MTNENKAQSAQNEPIADKSESSASVEAVKKSNSLLIRTLSAIVMVAIAGLAIYQGGWCFSYLTALVSLGLTYEYCRLVQNKGFKPNLTLCSICSMAMIVIGSSELQAAVIGWMYMAVVSWCLFCSALDNVFNHKERRSFIVDSAVNCFAVIYCGFLPSLLCFIRNVHIFIVVFLVVICIASDVGAYFFGKTMGRTKLSPLSPGKTWAGFWGALLCSIASIYGLLYWNFSTAVFVKYNMYFWLIMGIGCCLIGQLGDLFESSLKRDAGCKDSGSLIPGHGGVLDRVDSYLFASLFAYMWLTVCLSIPFLDNFFSR